MKSTAAWPSTLNVSNAKGTKWWLDSRTVYLVQFSCSACKTPTPSSLAALDEGEGANVSEHVTFHTSAFPSFHGAMMRHASGRFPSVLCSPAGSSWEGILAEVRALWMMLFTAVCHTLCYLQLLLKWLVCLWQRMSDQEHQLWGWPGTLPKVTWTSLAMKCSTEVGLDGGMHLPSQSSHLPLPLTWRVCRLALLTVFEWEQCLPLEMEFGVMLKWR